MPLLLSLVSVLRVLCYVFGSVPCTFFAPRPRAMVALRLQRPPVQLLLSYICAMPGVMVSPAVYYVGGHDRTEYLNGGFKVFRPGVVNVASSVFLVCIHFHSMYLHMN